MTQPIDANAGPESPITTNKIEEVDNGSLSPMEWAGYIGMAGGVGVIYAEYAATEVEQNLTASPAPEAIVVGAVLAVGGAGLAYLGSRRRRAREASEDLIDEDQFGNQARHTTLGNAILKLPDMLAGAVDDYSSKSKRTHFRIDSITNRYVARRFRGSDQLEVAGLNLIRRAKNGFMRDPDIGTITTPDRMIQRARDYVEAAEDLPMGAEGRSKGHEHYVRKTALALAAHRELLDR